MSDFLTDPNWKMNYLHYEDDGGYTCDFQNRVTGKIVWAVYYFQTNGPQLRAKYQRDVASIDVRLWLKKIREAETASLIS